MNSSLPNRDKFFEHYISRLFMFLLFTIIICKFRLKYIHVYSTMITIDVVILALIVFGVIKGVFKGLFVEVASIIALFLGSYGAIHFSNYASTLLSQALDWSEGSINIFSFVVTFLVIVLSIIITARGITKLANIMSLGIINRLLGGVFGGIKIAFIISILILILNNFKLMKVFVSNEDIKKAMFYKHVESIAPAILPIFIKQGRKLDFLETTG